MSDKLQVEQSWPLKIIFLQLAALSGFAIAQPLLQLIRQNPEFLTVHHAQRADVLILAVGLLVLPAMIMTLALGLAGLVGARFRRYSMGTLLAILLILLLLPFFDRFPGLEGWLTLAVSVISGVALVTRYFKSKFLQQGLTYLALAVPAFLTIFLAAPGVRSILLPESAREAGPQTDVSIPVVMIVFDELPTSSLMSPDLEIDAEIFPNFARLGATATWYRNATTISGATLRSVPAIMSGCFPAWNETPTLGDHPRNIFTLLESSHQIRALESQTSLCPDDLKTQAVPGLGRRLELDLSDLEILYQHVVVPGAWRDRLLPVSNKWGDYRGTAESKRAGQGPVTKVDQFRSFIAGLDTENRPPLAVAHVLLPHNPYRFFPDGKIYSWREKVPLQENGHWGDDQVLITHSYRRHLMQLATVDGLLGELLDKLEELGIMDEAIIVVTADHGASFRAGLSHRRFSEANAVDIMSVPLFIKIPGQDTGIIDDRFVQTIDIIPTLAAALGADPGWEVDGLDLGDAKTADRTELDFMDPDARIHRKISPTRIQERNEIIQWKSRLFGDSGGPERLFKMGDESGLVGRPSAEFQVREHPDWETQIVELEDLAIVDFNRIFIPAEINGTISGNVGQDGISLALGLNGSIAAVTRTYLPGEDPTQRSWQFLVPLETLRQGYNDVELYLVSEPASQGKLQRIPLKLPSFLGMDLGSRPMTRIIEEGFHQTGDWGGVPARWTNGQARLRIPLQKADRPNLLVVNLVSTGPKGTQVSISVNGTNLLTKNLPRGPWEGRLPLKDVELGRSLDVWLDSGIFIPAEIDSTSNDGRRLGVALTSVRVE